MSDRKPGHTVPSCQLIGSRTGHRKDVRVALGAIDWAHNTFTPDFKLSSIVGCTPPAELSDVKGVWEDQSNRSVTYPASVFR